MAITPNILDQSITPTGEPETPLQKSTFDLMKVAQAELQSVADGLRVKLAQTLVDLDSIGGTDDTKGSLSVVVRNFPRGIQYPFIQRLFLEVELTKARDELKAEGKIEQIGKKGNVVLKPKPQPVAVQPSPEPQTAS